MSVFFLLNIKKKKNYIDTFVYVIIHAEENT